MEHLSQPSTDPARAWTPQSWHGRPDPHAVRYGDAGALATALTKLGALPPLVTSWEIERLRSHLAEAESGRRFLLQGGDCAETLADCRPEVITSKLKILLQMSLVLVHGAKKPVIRVGRFAGQYAKPRSSPTETREVGGRAVTLPSYFGDLINNADFTQEGREPDPHLLVRGYQHAAMTLNFIRSLLEGGFADVHHPEYWDLSFVRGGALSPEHRAEYERVSASLAEALEFMEALGEARVDELTRVEFFTSHEGLNLLYESAQTRRVPRRDGWYDLTTHLPWVGERTRALDGAHVEFYRGIANPVGVKLGPGAEPEEVVELSRVLNPANTAGKLVLITRMGAGRVGASLPPMIDAMARAGRRAVWVCDPMHGNGRTTSAGIKTRAFEDIVRELETTFDVHAHAARSAAHAAGEGAARRDAGPRLGGVHFELTGEDVTECVGGASGITEDALTRNYASPCDPRLNYAQALELAFRVADRLRGKHA